MRAALLLATGCMGTYTPGSFPGKTHAIGDCLDIAVQHGVRPEAAGVVVVFHIGNRCDHRTVVDLASVRVAGESRYGVHLDLQPYDPRHEIAPLEIDAFGAGEEWIEYQPAGAYDWLDIDLGRIAGDEGANHMRLAVSQ
jgi:hypothetical protein